jgi:hypothetical protein
VYSSVIEFKRASSPMHAFSSTSGETIIFSVLSTMSSSGQPPFILVVGHPVGDFSDLLVTDSLLAMAAEGGYGPKVDPSLQMKVI